MSISPAHSNLAGDLLVTIAQPFPSINLSCSNETMKRFCHFTLFSSIRFLALESRYQKIRKSTTPMISKNGKSNKKRIKIAPRIGTMMSIMLPAPLNLAN